MSGRTPHAKYDDYVGTAAIDFSPSGKQLGSLLDTEGCGIVGFKFSVSQFGPSLTLFFVDLQGAGSTAEAVARHGETVQCKTFEVNDWDQGFDELCDQYFGEARIRAFENVVLGGRNVEIIGELA